MDTPINFDSESGSSYEHSYSASESGSGSESESFDSDFDPETLITKSNRKIETPRPSLTELQGILEKLDLEHEFMIEDMKQEEDDEKSLSDAIADIPQLASRNSESFHNDEKQDDSKDPSETTQPISTDDNADHETNTKRRGSIKHTESVTQTKIGKKWYINQYLCYKYLGKGSFGKVCLAKDILKNRKIAIKVLNKSLLRRKRILRKNKPPSNMLENIFREIAIMKKLNHPNVLHIHEVIDDPTNDKLYMVIDYMDNGSVLGEKGAEAKCDPMTDHELIRRYIRDMILGLDYLHTNDIIHGDIKPENLLLSVDNHLKIADFGVSFMLDSETCPNSDGKVSRSQGTPAFTAPETGSKSFSAFPIDVWAMGVTLYMMVTGLCPFAGNGLYDTYEKIQHEHPPIPTDIDEKMRDFLQRIMEKDPSKRITVKEAMEHEWITKNGTEPLEHPVYDENMKKFEKRVSVTKEDIEYAVSLPSETIKHLRRASIDLENKQNEIQIETETENNHNEKPKMTADSNSDSNQEYINDMIVVDGNSSKPIKDPVVEKTVSKQAQNNKEKKVKSTKIPRKPSREAPVAPKAIKTSKTPKKPSKKAPKTSKTNKAPKKQSKKTSKAIKTNKTPKKPTKEAPQLKKGGTKSPKKKTKKTPIGSPKNKALPISPKDTKKQSKGKKRKKDIQSPSNISPSFVKRKTASEIKRGNKAKKGNESKNSKDLTTNKAKSTAASGKTNKTAKAAAKRVKKVPKNKALPNKTK